MDLDSFEKDFRRFKARVTPMLEEYEAHKGKRDELSPELLAEIHAPLHKADEAQADPGPGPDPSGKPKGPTLKQWLAAGYKAKAYPPSPYPMTDTTQEELDAAIAAEDKAGQ